MKFKSSEYERRYSALWNESAVVADKKIKTTCGEIGFFSEQKPVYKQCLQQYAQAVKTIVGNLSRHLENKTFTDTVYINRYIEGTLKEAIKDFVGYRVRMVSRYTEKSDIVEFLDACLNEFNKMDPFNKMDIQSDENNSPGSSMEV